MTANKTIALAQKHFAAGNTTSALAILTAGIRSSLSTTQANKYHRAMRGLGYAASLDNHDNPTADDVVAIGPINWLS